MKKFIPALAILMAATAIHAASINWSINGQNTMVVLDKVGNPYASTVYLVLASDLSGITSATQTKEDFMSSLNAITLSTATSTDGKIPNVKNRVITDSRLTENVVTAFGMVIVSEDTDGNGFYKVYTNSKTPYADGAGTSAQVVVPTVWAMNNLQWNQGYAAALEPDPGPGGDDPTPAVPEPATGALALAGLALLFRRKRA